MSGRPVSICLRTYNVGFGDSFLLSFDYGDHERFVLIDCGSMAGPTGGKPASEVLLAVAQDVKERCRGRLDVVVATHRHKDHIEGFRRMKNGKGSGDVLSSCRPKAVLLPWTEDPNLDRKARGPHAPAGGLLREVRALVGMQLAAGGIWQEAEKLKDDLSSAVFQRLKFLGEDNLSNREALETLWAMGKRTPLRRCRYLYHGADPKLASILPGVRVRVLGPPTVEQCDRVLKHRRRDDSEYWHLMGVAGARVITKKSLSPFPKAEILPKPGPEHRWICRRLAQTRGELLYEVVRTVDRVLNNTSLILLFEVGKTSLLFPGDAQIESWEYLFRRKRDMKRLEDVSLYKVGHHGSLDATPKTVWNAFSRRTDRKRSAKRLRSVLSTRSGVHGKKNEVPRKKLVDELKALSELIDTRDLRRKLHGDDIVIPVEH